eukprot:CAMPEP_0194040528 /NCGR_PEP_ID=MMETSP0009_2-20130614/12499_1 /TAXON_ID=210454 /ORGANISM="Grammatophora oceanica, Strain CCMP 410" /LENGTH=333 /DNA_ID=CAMNT_0038683685 /DNA_START=76 /DNA_END=1078 /DNA_ORIENTATION=+
MAIRLAGLLLALTAASWLYAEGFIVPSRGCHSQAFRTTSREVRSNAELRYRVEAEDLKDEVRVHRKTALLDLLLEVPSNAPTPAKLTSEILEKVASLEEMCPSKDVDVLPTSGGTWELLWTTQDRRSREWRRNPVRAYINPLENQSYSNNPDGEGGRANPILPRFVQDRLERMGLLRPGSTKTRSTQVVDLQAGRVRNVVTLELPTLRRPTRTGRFARFRRRRRRNSEAAAGPPAEAFSPTKPRLASLTIIIRIRPNEIDLRKVDVKFEAAKLKLPGMPRAVNFPLGVVGPRGWLRTGYIDEDFRIPEGIKVLCSFFNGPRDDAKRYDPSERQ